MKKSDFYYELPAELIAQHPLERRDASRLLYLPGDGAEGALGLRDLHFTDLESLLRPGDCLVLNETRVIPARLLGRKKGGEAAAEILLLRRVQGDDWDCLLRPARRLKPGSFVELLPGRLEAEVLERLSDGRSLLRFHYEGIWEEILDEAGTMPLPPYIHERLADPERYQTVYAREKGSAAAPTAGLHFSPELLRHLEQCYTVVRLTLHVGLGTFRPVKEEEIEDHPMHSEHYVLSAEAARRINACKASGGRVIAVGTTSCRVLETCADEEGVLHPGEGETDIFIYPGYRFKILDALITNFHLPESTLVMLVSALAGRRRIPEAYRHAVRQSYRFFSFGDAMFIEKASDNLRPEPEVQGRAESLGIGGQR